MMKTKKALYHSGIALLVCISMFIGSTFAWFSDSVTSKKNIITAGNLDLEMYWTDDLNSGKWYNVEEDGHNTIFNYDNWEPGYTDVKYIKLVNAGKLALNYKLSLTPEDGVGKLAEVINVYYAEGGVELKERSDLQKMRAIGLLDNILNGGATADGTLLAEDQYSPLHPSGEVIMTVALNMLTTAGNEYQNEDSGKFTITALATQAPFEEDSFGKDYDANAEYPTMLKGDSATATVTPINGKVPAGGVTISGSNISAFVPEGTEMEAGAGKLTLKVTPLEKTTSDIIVVNNEILIPVDVHIDGVAESNTVPIIVNLGEILPKYLNMGNYHLYHVENGTNSVMQLVADASALTAHNTFTYDPLTGAVSVAMASFSEVAAVADTAAKWEGKRDYTWYNANATELTIANADQFAGLSAIVGGMDGQTQDSFSGKTIKLLSDINLNHGTVLPDEKGTTTIIFYPVGYYNNEGTYDRTETAISSGFQTFQGTFDGAGHTISNIYQNTWEMKGDHDWYAPEDQYYRDGMGLFGKVYGGTIKNLTVDNFKSDGEITTTGVVASYADGATFENIAITNCNPRVYNIGNGGIVGCVGWYAKEANLKTTFTNITIDSTNMISALWGSYDVACGGIVGQYYPTSGQTSAGSPKNAGIHFENCHVAAVMDVYNDVCANYQYYAYRYAGMMIGSIRENETIDGHVYPKMDGITAKGCTVHYDTWNDYFYCELVANTLASYTHDHQFSRLERVAKVEGTTITPLNGNAFTVPTSGRYNYVVVNGEFSTENAICYHFVDGKVWNHADAGTETVDGVAGVLKEDKQHIYLPFTQLFTGYGWGVTSKGIEDFAGIETMDITKSQQKDSVEKFASKADIDLSNIKKGDTVSVSDLFVAIDNAGVEIKNETVMVAVTDLTNTQITADFTRGNTWNKGSLKFNGSDGLVKITIQDYYFCKPTSVIVKVGDFDTTDRFAVAFPNTEKYLYRVGNQNAVSISSLFTAVDDASVGKVSVNVETINGNATTTYTPNDTWVNGTLKFNGTGVVNITISDDNFSTPVTLPVEVVHAYNVTKNDRVSNRNSVLLENVEMPTDGNVWLENVTLYGNGFAYDVTKAKDGNTISGYIGGNYAVALKNSILDNVQIIGEVYTKYGAQAKSEYNYPTILTNGNTIIANSYVSNGSSAIRAQDGNLQIINSTLEGGIFANLDIRGGTVTLDNVVTINQSRADGSSTSNDKGIVGLGIVFYECNVNAKLHVKTDANGKPLLKQYNCISKNTVFNETTANSLKTAMFNTAHKELQYTDANDVVWINPCILSMTEGIDGDNIDTLNGYTGKSASITGMEGYVYTVVPTDASVNLDTAQYESKNQYYILPVANFDHKAEQNYKAPSEGSNEHCYFNNDTNQLEISFDEGNTKVYDPNILSVSKNGTSLNYTVKIDGMDYTGKTVTFDKAGTHTAVYTYTDPYNFGLDRDSNVSTFDVNYTKEVIISVSAVASTAKDAKFTFYGYSSISKTAVTTITDVKTVSSKSGNLYIMPSATGDNVNSTTIDGITVNCPRVYVDFKDNTSDFNWLYPIFLGVKIEDYADGGKAETATTIVSPTSDSKPANFTILTTDKPSGGGGWSSGSGKSGSEGKISSGTYKNLYGWTSGALGSNQNASSIYCQFTYKDNKGTTYYYVIEFYRAQHNCPTVCITPDTLVTLANGSQVRVDALKGNEELLVWNHETGKLDKVPVAYIVNHNGEVAEREIIHLNFANGKTVKVIGEHVFFDATLNQYVAIDSISADTFINHTFAALDAEGTTVEKVTLVSVERTIEKTVAYEVVSYKHLTCFTEGILSTSAYLDPLLNVFDIDADDLVYTLESVQKDIETYGLYTYADFEGLISEDAFELYNAKYLKIAIGKGYITWDDILALIDIYFNVDVQPIK